MWQSVTATLKWRHLPLPFQLPPSCWTAETPGAEPGLPRNLSSHTRSAANKTQQISLFSLHFQRLSKKFWSSFIKISTSILLRERKTKPTPRNKFFLHKLTVTQLVNKVLAFCLTRMLITVFTTATWLRPNSDKSSWHPRILFLQRPVVKLSSHQHLCFPSGLLPPGVLRNTDWTLLSPVRVPCPVYITLFHLTTLLIFA